MNMKNALASLVMVAAISTPLILPATASAQTSHRQKTKNQWRNLGIAGGVAGAAGLLTHNKTLAVAGLAGGAYSAYRYEQDRKGQRRETDRLRRARAMRFKRAAQYRRTHHGYVSTAHHDNGRHLGWTKRHSVHH